MNRHITIEYRLTVLRLPMAILLAFLLTGPGRAQEVQRVFAFVSYDQGKAASGQVSPAKYQTARRVFDRLVQARGDFRQPAPVLVMETGERYVAWMDPGKGLIGLEEKAFDLCMAMGADSIAALAALLAHEMVHYYEKHDWNRHFALHNQELETARALGHMEEGLKQEAQADYLGGFLAATAGYPVHGLMPGLLPRIYAGYGLPAELRGYPSLEERVTMSANAMKRLRELQVAFETAGFLTLTGRYEAAAGYYRYLLQDFPSREIAGNAGVNLLLAATQLFPPGEFPYVLPVEWDAQSRLTGSRSVDAAREEKRRALLTQALDHFDRAMLLDPDYSPAYLNKACAHVLLGQEEDAAFWLRKGKKATTRHNPADYLTMEGLLAVLEGDFPEAERKWSRAISDAARRNLAILRKEIIAPVNTAPPTGVERIGSLNLEQYLRNPVLDVELELEKGIFTGEKRYPHSKVLVHYADNGRRFGVFQSCEGICSARTQAGIGIGSSWADLTGAYGPAGVHLSQVDGSRWLYPALGLYFRTGDKDSVTEWGLYRLSDE
jgi:tetratricopeptide (TPR) repeat protein